MEPGNPELEIAVDELLREDNPHTIARRIQAERLSISIREQGLSIYPLSRIEPSTPEQVVKRIQELLGQKDK